MIQAPFSEVSGIYRFVGQFSGKETAVQTTKQSVLERLVIYSNVTNALMSYAQVKDGKVEFSREYVLPAFVQLRAKQIFEEAGVL